MAKLTIEWSERKTTTTGKTYLKANLKDETGAVYENVSIWSDFPNFANLMTGNTVEAEVVTKGDYKNLKPLFGSKQASGAFKAKQIEETMEKKSEYIAHAQQNKELGIKVTSTLRMAVDLAIGNKGDGDVTEQAIEHWRKYLWLQWDKKDTDYPAF